MSRRRCSSGPLAVAFAGVLVATSSVAGAKTTNFIELNAGAGYSSNPLLRQDSQSSAFGRLSAFGLHSWESERGSTSLSAYVENTTYLNDYGSKQIFNLAAQTHQSISPNVTVFGDLGFSGDISGQLSNRLISVPTQPPVVDPTNPLPPPTTLPDVLGLTGRQYRLNGQLGASIRTSPVSTVSVSAGAQRIFFSGDNADDLDYNVYFASAGYTRQLSERTSVGGTLFLQRQDFSHGDYSNVVNPVVTVHTQLSERFSADAAVGVMYIEQSRDGDNGHSFSPSFSGALCRAGSLDRFCARISRDAQSSLSSRLDSNGGDTSVSTTGSIDYFRLLGEGQTVQFGLSAVRYSSPGLLPDDNFQTTYVSAVGGYDRKIGNRLYAGLTVGARHVFQDGPDPDIDLNAAIQLRYRIGDVQ